MNTCEGLAVVPNLLAIKLWYVSNFLFARPPSPRLPAVCYSSLHQLAAATRNPSASSTGANSARRNHAARKSSGGSHCGGGGPVCGSCLGEWQRRIVCRSGGSGCSDGGAWVGQYAGSGSVAGAGT